MRNDPLYLLELNFAVFLFGGAGLFGKILNYPASTIVFFRVLFSSVTLFFFIKIKGVKFNLFDKKSYYELILTAFLLSFHWITFFQSVKVSTVAIALLSYSTFPVFISIIEPIFFKTKILVREILIAAISFIGIFILTHSYSLSSPEFEGVLLGVISGLLFALLSILNRRTVRKNGALLTTFYQHLFSIPLLLPSLIFLNKSFSFNDFMYFVLLGSLFTAVAHLLYINSLVRFKAFISGIFATLEPIYGAIFAFFIIKEVPSINTVLGGIIILTASISAIIFSKKGG